MVKSLRKKSVAPEVVADDTPSASKANGADGTAEEKPLAADNEKTTSERVNDNGGNDDREGGTADDSERTTGSVRADASELNLKSIEEEYLDRRETARIMMHLISELNSPFFCKTDQSRLMPRSRSITYRSTAFVPRWYYILVYHIYICNASDFSIRSFGEEGGNDIIDRLITTCDLPNYR